MNPNKNSSQELKIKLDSIIGESNVLKIELNKILAQMNEQIEKWQIQEKSKSDDDLLKKPLK